MTTKILTQERLRHVLDYDPETGVFIWCVATSQRTKIGSIAGGKDSYGYFHVQIDSKCYKAHRLAWLYVYGVWPVGVIDHINRNREDNRIANLRDVTASQNMRNCKIRKTNTSGYKGVSYLAAKKRWAAQIYLTGKNTLLGLFDTADAAAQAYVATAKAHGLEY
jgi:hypothetical protein